MKKMLKALAIAFTVVAAVAACTKPEDQPKEVELTGIELNATTQALQVGQEFQLTVTYKPENVTNKPAASWASDAPAVATVDAGKVTAVAAGTANITATVGKFTASCAVTVTSAEEEIVPVEGNSAWSVIGAFLDSNWEKDYVCAEKDGAFVLKNVKLSKDNQVKFRKDKGWDVNRGINEPDKAAELAANTPVEAIQGGGNIIIPADGIYDLYYFAEKEAIVYVAKDAALPEIPDFTKETSFVSPDWANVGAITEGNHTFKFTKDENYAYFYTERPRDSRFDELWGKGAGYVYFAFDLDGDPTNGQTLNSNGPYDYIAFIYCFGGSASEPVLGITADGDVLPDTYNVDNVIAQGTVDQNGLKLEYRIPLADLPALPETFEITTWGNKGLSKVHYAYPYVEPPYEHDYTPGADYLAASNLWKAVDDAGVGHFFINCVNDGVDDVWLRNGEATSDGVYAFSKEQSTYKMHYDVASAGDWQRQIFLFPKEENAIPLVAGDKYNFKMSVYANKKLPRIFFKIVSYQADKDNKEGNIVFNYETIKEVNPGSQPTVIEFSELPASFSTDNITFVIDFGGAPEDVDIYIKDITLEKVGGEPVEEFDFTPSEEYLADGNLWKAVDAACPDIYFYHCSGGADNWDGKDTHVTSMDDVPFATFNQSTYTLKLDGLTNDQWMNQFFLFPKAENAIPVAPGEKLSFKATITADMDHPSAFFKLVTYNPAKPDKPEGATLWEAGAMAVTAGEPLVIENANIVVPDGISSDNIVLVFDFGKNPAGITIHIKDIIVAPEEAGSSVSEIIAMADGTAVTTKPSLVMAKCKRGVILSDGTKNIYAYNSAGVETEVGDMVVISGTKKVYNGVPEIDAAVVDKVKSSNNTVDYPAARDITSSVETYSSAEAEFIVLEGTLAKSGNYYNMTIDGVDPNTKVGSIQYPVDALDADSYDGKKIDVVGYFNGLSGGGKYVNIVTVKIEEVSDTPAVNIVLDGNLSDWDAIEGVEAGSFKDFKFASDADNIYMYFKIKRSKIIAAKTEPFVFNWRRYIAFGIDTDNNAETGSAVTFAGMNIPGCEVGGNFYPFRGTASEASGTDNVEIVNGVEEQGGVSTTIGSNVPDGATDKVSAYGQVDDEFVYVEAGFARSAAGSPAAGTIKIQLSLAWDLTDILEYTLN